MEYFCCLNEKIIEYSMLPEYIKNHICLMTNREKDVEEDFFLEVLKIIKNNEKCGFGSGRNSILRELNKKNLITTEAVIRKILCDMNRLGYIKSNKGRGGSVLTSTGEKFIFNEI